jgi:eukaryotic-like serine/threonine-protein kinase
VQRIGPYVVTGELGRGATGVVLRARDPSGAEVAIKALAPRDEHQRRRIQREVEALRRLRHPNVVHVRDAGEQAGRPFIVMDLLPGDSLQSRLDREGPLPIPEAVALTRAIAGALSHVHGLGLLHRDLKPANILLAADGTPRLADFGLVGRTEGHSLTRTGELMGTPGFWAPELAAGDLGRLTPACDLYGLGATLYALLTGQPPFVAASLLEAAVQVQEETPSPPSARRREVGSELDAIVLRCLAKRSSRTASPTRTRWSSRSPRAVGRARGAPSRRAWPSPRRRCRRSSASPRSRGRRRRDRPSSRPS